MRGSKCAVPGCGMNDRTAQTSLSFFSFPNDRKQVWCSTFDIDITNLNTRDKVCGNHFAPTSFCTPSRIRLKPGANPISLPSNSSPVSSNVNQPSLRNTELVNAAWTSTAQPLAVPNTPGIVGARKRPFILCAPSQKSCLTSTTSVSTQTLKENVQYDQSPLKKKVKSLQDKVRYYKLKSERSPSEKDFDWELFLNSIKTIAPEVKTFLFSQIKRAKEAEKKKRPQYTWDEKDLAINLYYTLGKRAYNNLRDREFFLPTVRCIGNWMDSVNFKTGINEGLFDFLKDYVTSLSAKDKVCVLTWDEMTIKKYLIYNANEDKLDGVHDHGGTSREPKIANYALVVMVRSLNSKWVFPISYYFSSGPTTKEELRHIIEECMAQLEKIGLDLRITVCDQGPSNQGLLSLLGVGVEFPYITRKGKKIYMIFDTPHLIKNIRTALLNHGISIGVKKIEWRHVVKLYELDTATENRGTKLTKSHVYPTEPDKMKVSLATQVFSHRVSQLMYYYIGRDKFSDDDMVGATETAEFIGEMDEMFDYFNMSTADCPAKPRKAGKLVFDNMSLLTKYVKWVQHWKCLDGGKKPDCFNGLILTIRGMRMLLEDLKFEPFPNNGVNEQFSCVCTRRIQQDCLEHYFGFQRYRCGCGTNPTAKQFQENFKYLFIVRNLKIIGGNCQEFEETKGLIDSFEMLATIQRDNGVEIFSSYDDDLPDLDIEDVEENETILIHPLFSKFFKNGLEDKDDNVAVYMGNWAVQTILKRHHCESCESGLLDFLQSRDDTSTLFDKSEEIVFMFAYNTNIILENNINLCYCHLLNIDGRNAFIEGMKRFRLAMNYNLKRRGTQVLQDIFDYVQRGDDMSKWLQDVNGECSQHRIEMVKLYLKVKVYGLVRIVNYDIFIPKGNRTTVAELRFRISFMTLQTCPHLLIIVINWL